MNKDSILLVGAGGHAKACIDIIEQEDRFIIAGLIGAADQVGNQIYGYSVLATDEELPHLSSHYKYALVAVGQIKTPKLRIHLFNLLEQAGFELPVIISPHAYISSHAVLNAGTIVMHGVMVNADASIGRNCILNSQSLVEHDVIIADHCHISTAAIINGGVQVGEGTFVGSNSVIRESVKIGAHCVIGMGQQIFDNLTDNSVVGRKSSCAL